MLSGRKRFTKENGAETVIRLGRSERMRSLLPSSWMKSGEE